MSSVFSTLFSNDPTQTEVPWTFGDYLTGAITGKIPDSVNAQQNKDLFGNILAAGGTNAQATAAVNEQNTFVSQYEGGTGGNPLSALGVALGLTSGSVPAAGVNWGMITLIAIVAVVVLVLVKRR